MLACGEHYANMLKGRFNLHSTRCFADCMQLLAILLICSAPRFGTGHAADTE